MVRNIQNYGAWLTKTSPSQPLFRDEKVTILDHVAASYLAAWAAGPSDCVAFESYSRAFKRAIVSGQQASGS